VNTANGRSDREREWAEVIDICFRDQAAVSPSEQLPAPAQESDVSLRDLSIRSKQLVRADRWLKKRRLVLLLATFSFAVIDATLIGLARVETDHFLHILVRYGLASWFLGWFGLRLFLFVDDEHSERSELTGYCIGVWILMGVPCLIAGWLIAGWR